MDNRLLHNLVRIRAEQNPDVIAADDDQNSITYAMLDELSTRMAVRLRTMGVSHGVTVGVYLGKSVEAIIAFIAVLKAGGIYIPLDAHYSPSERIRTILALSQTGVLVTDTAHKLKLDDTCSRKRHTCATLLTDDLLKPFREKESLMCSFASATSHAVPAAQADRIAPEPDFPETTPGATAYILYTSGSTGVPKGVMITHRNAMTFINWAVDTFRFPAGTVFANHAPFHFDLSVFDLYVAFATGGTVRLVPPSIMANPRALARWIEVAGINVWYSVPSVWIAMLTYARLERTAFDKLQTILFAGEVFPNRFLRELMNRLPHCRYFNLYGPTETNVCTWHEVSVNETAGDKPVPIGKACTGTTATVFDDDCNEVPEGSEGELFVSGPLVAAGYYRDPERTAGSFITLHDDKRDNRQWYATGDIVQRLTHDTFRYVGRKDLMVKCAGFRIELQEIEKVLHTYPGITEAVVVSRYREERGNTFLVAYCTMEEGYELRTAGVRSWLGTRLPNYMIPETVTVLPELPRNANGKIDRHLLTVHPEAIPSA